MNSQLALVDGVPSEASLDQLFRPFNATKRWGVWAAKTLHFVRPTVFPVLDSCAKKALGVSSLGGTARDYRRFIELFRNTLLHNADAMAAAAEIDGGESPTDVKLLDKVLYEVGRRLGC